MSKRIVLGSHLSSEALSRRYREATDAVEHSHYQIIWLLALGKIVMEVTQVTGYSRI